MGNFRGIAPCISKGQKTRQRTPKIGILIPTYNHGMTIEQVVNDCLQYLQDIIVVVDGATDDTLPKLQKLPVHLLHFPQNRGKGAALKAGFCEAEELGWDYAITIDSDGQHLAADIPQFLQEISLSEQAIVIGDRDMSAPNIPGSSKFGKNFTNFWLKVETGMDIADGQSGFRAYPVVFINQITTWCNRYEFEVEVLAKAAWRGINIVSVPVRVDYQPQGGRVSHFRLFRDNVRTSVLNSMLVTMRIYNIIVQFFTK